MNIDFGKYADGLAPAVVQDAATQKVLMVGFVSAESLTATQTSKKVTFFSRQRQRLWTKGETSGNYLIVEEILTDCDADTVLIKARPAGPVCHTGADTCFGEKNESGAFLSKLERVIAERKAVPSEASYTSRLLGAGINKIAQKVGEEAVELIIEAKDADDERFAAEAADLLYHLMVLFAAKNIKFSAAINVLERRHGGR